MSPTVRISVLAALAAGSATALVMHQLHERAETALTLELPEVTPVVEAKPLAPARPGAPTVLFVVFDTTRADHLSACGYDRPTSPTLERLVREGASLSCEARTPGSWTVPSHASYFTGLPVPAHGADNKRLPTAEADSLGAMQIARPAAWATLEERWLTLPLAETHTTVAETYRGRGYQTVMISANKVMAKALGMTQGFDAVAYPAGTTFLQGLRSFETAGDPNDLLPQLLAGLDPARPLFLYVNFFHTHNPWDGVPPGHDWLPERPRLAYLFGDDGDPWTSYENGQLGPAESAELLAHLRDVYDWGVRRNDDGLDRLLRTLHDTGWSSSGLRLVLVGDHGEMLGEHGLLDHGRTMLEPNTRVPLLVHDTAGTPALPPGPVSATLVHPLLVDGQLPAAPPPVVSHGFPMWSHALFEHPRAGHREAAIWEGTRKLVWSEGTFAAYDLSTDPGETTPLPVTDAERARLQAEADAMEAVSQRTQRGGEVEMMEALKAAGYVE